MSVGVHRPSDYWWPTLSIQDLCVDVVHVHVTPLYYVFAAVLRVGYNCKCVTWCSSISVKYRQFGPSYSQRLVWHARDAVSRSIQLPKFNSRKMAYGLPIFFQVRRQLGWRFSALSMGTLADVWHIVTGAVRSPAFIPQALGAVVGVATLNGGRWRLDEVWHHSPDGSTSLDSTLQ